MKVALRSGQIVWLAVATPPTRDPRPTIREAVTATNVATGAQTALGSQVDGASPAEHAV